MGKQTKNFKVFQASAGSGKTYTIIKEYLSLCLRSANSPLFFKDLRHIIFVSSRIHFH